jgi:hypothetical protein
MLTGGHEEVACGDCHRNNQFENAPRACVTCHAIDDTHAGSNGNACSDCHSTSAWSTIGFDHALKTGFALVAGHGSLTCNDCHKREDNKDDFSAGCVGCHASDDSHQGRHGVECGDCHEPTEWPQAHFNHDSTGFSLVDAHERLRCNSCHTQEISVALDSSCGSCHQFDDTHAGQLGSSCGSCHTQLDWNNSIAFDHDLSSFPLTGLHATVACGACHSSSRFADAPSACIDCHGGDDVHEGSLGKACGSCHTSNGWTLTVFDHDEHTDFPLQEGHANVPCTACHIDAANNPGNVPSTCGGCHTTDDVHDGQFSVNCGSCHTISSFDQIKRLTGS